RRRQQRLVWPGSRPLPCRTIRPVDFLAILRDLADEALLPALKDDELTGLGDPPGRPLPLLVDQEQDASLLEDGASLVLLAVVQPLTRQLGFLVRLGRASEASQREQAPRSSHSLHHVPALEVRGHQAPPLQYENTVALGATREKPRGKRTKRLP